MGRSRKSAERNVGGDGCLLQTPFEKQTGRPAMTLRHRLLPIVYETFAVVASADDSVEAARKTNPTTAIKIVGTANVMPV